MVDPSTQIRADTLVQGGHAGPPLQEGHEMPHNAGDRRRTMRLAGYDYTEPSAYFVTICTQARQCLFGEVVGDSMCLNDAGRMVARWWQAIPTKFRSIELDEYVVMPNHIHGIIVIVGADQRVRPHIDGAKTSLLKIMQWFKTMTT